MRSSSLSKVVRTGLSVAVALGLAFGAAVARAEGQRQANRESARSLADDGADAFARGDYAEAHEHLQQAFLLVEAPTIALLDARALVKLGRFVEARAAYRRALEVPVTDASPPAFRDAVASADVEARALEGRLSWVTLRVRHAPPGARIQVWLDGAEVAPHAVGTPLAVDPADHTVRLDVDGRRVFSRRLSLREGEKRAVELDVPTRGEPFPALAVTGFGVGGAGIVTGIVAGSLAISARRDAARDCPARRCVDGSPGAAALHEFRTLRTVSTIGYGVGVAGAALGTVLLLTRSESTEVEVGIVPSLQGVNVGGTF